MKFTFKCWDKDRLREISAMGGRATKGIKKPRGTKQVKEKRPPYRWTPEQAREAGKKGGTISQLRKSLGA